MDAVLLQFWLAGLTGLAEASTVDQRAIWKSVVLVKVILPSGRWNGGLANVWTCRSSGDPAIHFRVDPKHCRSIVFCNGRGKSTSQ